MKTVEELAEEYRAYTLHDLSFKGLNETIEKAFISGYKKSKEWISVDENNMPKIGSDVVFVDFDHLFSKELYQMITKEQISDILKYTEFTHWRYID